MGVAGICVCFLELDRDKPNNAILLLLPIAARFSFLTVHHSYFVLKEVLWSFLRNVPK